MYLNLCMYFLHPEIKASAILLCNARRQFSSDGCLSRCMHSARARRGACNHPRRDPRRTHAVYCNARSQVLSFFATFLSFFAHHDAPPLLLLDALPRLPGARSPFLAARCCLGYPATHLCAGTCTPTPIACNTRAFVASSLFHNTRNGRVDGHVWGQGGTG